MARKTPEQLAREFEGRKAKGLARGAAAYWPNVLANALLKRIAGDGDISLAALTASLEQDAQSPDIALKAGAEEAIARLRQAAAKRA
jgi:hypothetical protein